MAYRCGNSSGIAVPCLMNGQCVVTSDGNEVCICPEGWGHDFVGFGHFSNCALPDKFLLWFVIAFTIIFWILFLYSFVKLHQVNLQKGKLRNILLSGLAWSFSSWVHVLCVFLENGFYEASLVSLCFVCILGFTVSYFATPLVLGPILLRSGLLVIAKNMQKWLFRLTILSSICIIAVTGGLLATCRDANTRIYNILMFSLLFGVLSILVVEVLGIVLASRKLRKLLPAEAVTVLRQLEAIIHFAYLVLTAASGTIGFLIVWMVVKSFPFMYVQWASCQLLVLVIMLYMRPMMSNIKTKSTEQMNINANRFSGRRDNASGDDDNRSSHSATISSSKKARSLGLKPRKNKKPSRDIKAMTRITEIEESDRGSVVSSMQNADRLEAFTEER